MNLYVDLDTLQLITAANNRRQVSIISAKRGDALPLTVRFIRDGLPVRLDATTVIKFAIKENGKYDDAPLVLQDGFVASTVEDPDSDPSYSATPSLNTTELNALFLINADSSDDPASLDLMAEITWEATGDTGPTTIKTFTLRTENDVYRGTEDTPTSLATPGDWLDTENINRGIQPIRTGATNLFPDSITILGEVIADDLSSIPLSPLLFVSINASGFPVYSVNIEDGVLDLYNASGEWFFEYTGAEVAGAAEWNLVDDKTDPTGLVLSAAGRDDITITATSGILTPQLGDLGQLTGSGEFQRWNGTIWETETLQKSDLPEYANDAAADADGDLTSNSFYKLTSDRTVYQKP